VTTGLYRHEGLREPQGDNRARYRELLAQWQNGPPEPAQESAERKLAPASQARGPLTNPSRKEAMTAAMQANRARMRPIHGRRG
jgi:hypothetical protein